MNYKGFDKDLKCRGFQYEVDKDYEEPEATVCNKGFHACENPFDVFGYYPPADSRYCEVEQSGELSQSLKDSKVASTKIHIGAEIGLDGMIEAGVKFIKDKIEWDEASETNTGDWSAATNTGDWSVAIVSGADSVALSMGIEGRAKGSLGCYIVLAEWYKDEDDVWHIKELKSAKVDGENIKADTFYRLVDGEFVEEK